MQKNVFLHSGNLLENCRMAIPSWYTYKISKYTKYRLKKLPKHQVSSLKHQVPNIQVYQASETEELASSLGCYKNIMPQVHE